MLEGVSPGEVGCGLLGQVPAALWNPPGMEEDPLSPSSPPPACGAAAVVRGQLILEDAERVM